MIYVSSIANCHRKYINNNEFKYQPLKKNRPIQRNNNLVSI